MQQLSFYDEKQEFISPSAYAHWQRVWRLLPEDLPYKLWYEPRKGTEAFELFPLSISAVRFGDGYTHALTVVWGDAEGQHTFRHTISREAPLGLVGSTSTPRPEEAI